MALKPPAGRLVCNLLTILRYRQRMATRHGNKQATGALRQRHDLLRHWLQALDGLEDLGCGTGPASKQPVPKISPDKATRPALRSRG